MFAETVGEVFHAFYEYPLAGFAMLLLPVLLYRYCFIYFKTSLRTDEAVQPKLQGASKNRVTVADILSFLQDAECHRRIFECGHSRYFRIGIQKQNVPHN